MYYKSMITPTPFGVIAIFETLENALREKLIDQDASCEERKYCL